MNNKIKVKILGNSPYDGHNDVIGDVGYIDGYVRGVDDRPYVVVIIPRTKQIVLTMPHNLEVIIDN